METIKERDGTEVRLFEKAEFGTIRTIVIDGNPWFVVKDVCDILGIQNVTQSTNQLEDFERSMFNIGRQGEANIISESGFYTLVLRSRKPIAKPFRLWVTSEVLPSVRKTGKYIDKTGKELELMLGDMRNDFKIVYVQLNSMENIINEQSEKLDSVMDNMTLTTVQQGRIQRVVKDRVGELLGGAHSTEYKENSRMYFINLWNNLKSKFKCGSRWQDLNPAYYNAAIDFIEDWEYIKE